jgi:hypothetical protein
VRESVPYLVSKDGPNAHFFKFQTIKRVNHVEQHLLRNISKQYQESLTQGRQNYQDYLRTVRSKQPYLHT